MLGALFVDDQLLALDAVSEGQYAVQRFSTSYLVSVLP